MIKGIYKNPRVNIILSCKRLHTLPLTLGTSRDVCIGNSRCCIGNSRLHNWAGKKEHPDWEEKIKLPLFTDDMIFRHVENTQWKKMYNGVYKYLLELKSDFIEVARYKATYKNHVCICSSN